MNVSRRQRAMKVDAVLLMGGNIRGGTDYPLNAFFSLEGIPPNPCFPLTLTRYTYPISSSPFSYVHYLSFSFCSFCPARPFFPSTCHQRTYPCNAPLALLYLVFTFFFFLLFWSPSLFFVLVLTLTQPSKLRSSLTRHWASFRCPDGYWMKVFLLSQCLSCHSHSLSRHRYTLITRPRTSPHSNAHYTIPSLSSHQLSLTRHYINPCWHHLSSHHIFSHFSLSFPLLIHHGPPLLPWHPLPLLYGSPLHQALHQHMLAIQFPDGCNMT